MATTDRHADTWEYVTYAPAERHCSVCKRVVKPTEPVRRGMVERSSGPPVTVYRHANECPGL
ncbi:hypothetical protein [Streptomyces ehimensis]|uniref:Uncharacterized protein n=1 Tax=Streptomyces ehimensis TaxID=68195 RepID=A0ABV9BQM5_9ACTN